MNKITEQDIQEARDSWNSFDRVEPQLIPTPTRHFEIGEQVRVGNLDDVIVREVLYDGKAYRVDYTRTEKRQGEVTGSMRYTGFWWWFDINTMQFANKDAEDTFAPHLPGQVSTTSLDSFTHMMAHGGLVCDPRYQRGYVWTLEDQRSLIGSIFNRIGIGSFMFCRHSGYLHDDSDETVEYITLDGDRVTIPRKKDYTLAIIDGQQRLTTIWRYMTNQFDYNGRYWRDLSPRDQFDFTGSLVSTRIFNEDDVSYEQVLKIFLLVNKGVPQDDSHLEMVEKELSSL